MGLLVLLHGCLVVCFAGWVCLVDPCGGFAVLEMLFWFAWGCVVLESAAVCPGFIVCSDGWVLWFDMFLVFFVVFVSLCVVYCDFEMGTVVVRTCCVFGIAVLVFCIVLLVCCTYTSCCRLWVLLVRLSFGDV